MKLNNIRHCGFERLYEGVKIGKIENIGNYGKNLSMYISHCMLTLYLSDISTIELFFLKKLTPEIEITMYDYENFINLEEYSDGSKVENLLNIYTEILNDEDIIKNINNVNMVPIGCKKHTVIVTFKGMKITSILGCLIKDLFLDNQGNLYKEYPGTETMNNVIFKTFYKNFYSFIRDELIAVDVLSDFMINRKFYQYTNDDVQISHVMTPHGDISFFGNTGEGLQKQISDIKSSIQMSPHKFEDDIYLVFTMNTTFNLFMKYFMDTNYVIDHEDLKIVYSSKSCSIEQDIDRKYSVRISENIDYIFGFMNYVNSKPDMSINRFNLIPFGSEIKYSISVPYKEIDSFIKYNDECATAQECKNVSSKLKSMYLTVNKLLGL